MTVSHLQNQTLGIGVDFYRLLHIPRSGSAIAFIAIWMSA